MKPEQQQLPKSRIGYKESSGAECTHLIEPDAGLAALQACSAAARLQAAAAGAAAQLPVGRSRRRHVSVLPPLRPLPRLRHHTGTELRIVKLSRCQQELLPLTVTSPYDKPSDAQAGFFI